MTQTFSRRQTMSGILGLGTAGLLQACAQTPVRSTPARAAVAAVVPTQSTTVDAVTQSLLNVVRRDRTPPPAATRAFAMAHMAGFLAVNGLTPRYQSRHRIGTGPTGADPDAAYIAAFSHAAASALGTAVAAPHLARLPNSDAKGRGVAWGQTVGRYVARLRAQDGATRANSRSYAQKRGPMAWVPTGNHHGARGLIPTPTQRQSALLPSWGKLRPFGINAARSFLPEPFPAASSVEFARQFDKVKAIGAWAQAQRTAEQTQIAFFWEDGPGGVTPPGHWQLIGLRTLAPLGLDLVTFAHHMALLSMAQADAAIVAWDSKYHYDVVRPETAIRIHANSYPNAAMRGAGDARWLSVIPSPPFPAYVSGHSAFAGASARMLANVIGTDSLRVSGAAADPQLWPVHLTGVTRSWSGLWAAAQECGDSREYGGVHWEHDNSQGLIAGRRIADAIFRSEFSS